jgi:NAD(P)-dependent dehydrogenase (short-subunit alcohol dehydrogenase family)
MPLAQMPISSPFGARSLASDVVKGIDLKGKTAIVTGASSGLGIETARALAGAGARVILPVRSPAKGEEAAADIRATTGNDAVEVAHMDLADWKSVRLFAAAFLKSGAALNILINNAGIMATPERRIMGNIESQFGTNHLGHMLLTALLAPALLKAAPARVVELTSIGHRLSPIHFDDLNFLHRPYEKWSAYGQSKTANSLFAVELNRRLEPKGVTAFGVQPGGIMTNLQRDLSQEEIRAFGWVDANGKVHEGFKTQAGGAATSVWCATSALLAEGGVYCEDCNIAAAVPADDKGFSGVRPWAIDPDAARKLWTLSEKLLGETFAI